MITKRNRKSYILLALVQAFILVFVAWNGLDPDFGWHIKLGELIIKSGIPQTDPFSYTMPSFEYIDHEWLTNITMHLVFSVSGKIGTALFFTVITAAALVIIFPKKATVAAHASLLLTLTTFLPRFGIRPQVISWLFVAITTRLITSDRNWKRYRYLYPVLIIIWANTHGSFPVGIFMITIFILSKIVSDKNIMQNIQTQKTDLTILGLTLFAPLINPYKAKIWSEVIRQATDTNQRLFIAEWLPAASRADLAFITATLLTLILSYRYKNKLKIHLFVISATLLTLSIISQRHIPLFMIANTPLLIWLLAKLKKEAEKYRFGKKRFNTLAKGLLIGSITFLLIENTLAYSSSNNIQENNFYPKTAVEYLNSKKLDGRIATIYSWGGYVIWKMPEQKTFIDGRMPSFFDKKAPRHESISALNDYIELTETGDLSHLKKYDVKYILWPKEKDQNKTFEKKIPFRFLKKPQKKSFIENIKNAGWIKTYSDHNSVVYEHIQ